MQVQVKESIVSIVIMIGWQEAENIMKTENDEQKNDKNGNHSENDYHQTQMSIEIKISLHRLQNLQNRLQILAFSLYHRYLLPRYLCWS